MCAKQTRTRAALVAGVAAAAAVFPVLTSPRAEAASMQSISAERQAGGYSVSLHTHLDAAPLAVYAVLADAAHWRRLTPDLRQVEVLDQHRDGAMELLTAFQACLLWYCGTLHAVPDVFLAPDSAGGDIYLIARPGMGDFRSGQAHCRLRASGSGTDLEFTAEVSPAFFVPPVIGPWLLARWLRGAALQASTNLEALARGGARLGAVEPRTATDRAIYHPVQ